MQPENHVVTHTVGVANLLNALAKGGTIDPKTGEFIPKRLTYTVSKYQVDMAIWKMQKAGTLEAVIEIKDKAKSLGLIKSHEKQLREAFAECYRKFKPTISQKGNEDGDQKKEKDQ